MRQFLLIAASLLLPHMSAAQCADDAQVAGFVQDFLTKTPTKSIGVGGSMQDAYCTQAKIAAAFAPHLGPVIGYKAGLTSKPAMARFGVTEPVRGVLYRDMMLSDNAELPTQFGAISLFEADLILVVGSDEINTARTPEEVMSHISAVHPFMELPDLMVAKGEPLTAETITAMGVGARLGILGDAIAVQDPAAMSDALANMQVTVKDASGEVLSKAPGAAVLGHPANAVIWLVKSGVTFKSGDLISVGSIGPLHPAAKSKGGASVSYAGLPGDPVLNVTFTTE